MKTLVDVFTRVALKEKRRLSHKAIKFYRQLLHTVTLPKSNKDEALNNLELERMKARTLTSVRNEFNRQLDALL